MPAQQRPPIQRSIQHCPICGVAMLASKSNEGSPQFDTFSCLKCDAVMTFASPRGGPAPDK